MNKYNVLLVALVATFSMTLNVACSAKKSTDTTTPSTGGGGGGGSIAIPAVMSGRTLLRCDTMTASDGAQLNGKTNSVGLVLNADGTYHYYITYAGGTSCSGGFFSSGSQDNFDYDQRGTYVIDADLGGNSYEVTFTSTSQTATGRSSGNGAAVRTGFNANCPTLNLAINNDVTVDNVYCGNSNDTNYIPPGFPAQAGTYKQIISIPGTAQGTSALIGTRPYAWSLGVSGSYPSGTETWKVYQ